MLKGYFPGFIAGWQIGLKTSYSNFKEVSELSREVISPTFTSNKNLNIYTKENQGTFIKALWFGKEKDELLDFTEGKVLFSFDLPKEIAYAIVNNEDFQVSLDVLVPEFIDSNGKVVTEKVKFEVFIK